MNKQKQIEAMARMDGFTEGKNITYPQYWYKNSIIYANGGRENDNNLPNYLNDLNDVQRVINNLKFTGMNDDSEYDRYWSRLRDICGGVIYMQRATAAQKTEAILKAKGVWEDE